MQSSKKKYPDMLRAIALSFSTGRTATAGFGLLWTILIAVISLKMLTCFHDYETFSPVSIRKTLLNVRENGLGQKFILVSLPIVALWMVGLQWFFGLTMRAGAIELAGLKEEKVIPRHLRVGSAFVVPVALSLPAILLGFGPLWALTLCIDGTFGTILSAITLPFALIPVGIGAFVGGVMLYASPMYVPATMADGNDAFDAVGASISYVVRNPVYYILLWLQKFAVVLLSTIVACAMLAVMWGAIGMGVWLIRGEAVVDESLEVVFEGSIPSLSRDWIPLILGNFFWGTVAVALSWVLLVSANCDLMIYVTLRRRTDGVPFDRVQSIQSVKDLMTATSTAKMAELAHERWDEDQSKTAEKPEENANQ